MTKKSTQLEFKKVGGWGGKRKGSGRKKIGDKLNHVTRPRVDFKKPLHVTHKLVKNCPSLRQRDLLKLFQKSATQAKAYGLHVIHFALLKNHVHAIIEAQDNQALHSGMVSLFASFAKGLNERAKRTGKVFYDRYHLEVITCPTQMKRALEYVLLNYSKHAKMLEHMDPFSSARYFKDWTKLIGKRMNEVLKWELPSISDDLASAGLSPPRSWLANRGWMRAR